MRVLVVTRREPWPLNGGGRLYLHQVLEQLSRRAEVTLALAEVPRHRDRLPGRIAVETTLPAPTGDRPQPAARRGTSLVGRLARRHFGYRQAVQAWLHRHARPQRFDVVLLHGAVFGQYAPACHVPVVWDPVDEMVLHTVRDAQYADWRRWPAAIRHALLYAWYERHVMDHAAATVFVSAVDAAYARRWAGPARIEAVPFGVDFEYFRATAEPPVPGTVAFIGSLEFPPNIDAIVHFARRVWPQIQARGAGRRLVVVGRRPVAAVRALTAVPGVELHPDVPDVRPYLTQAAAVVVPTRKGGGLKTKVLEACAMRRAVVASPRALGGLSPRIGVDLLPADRPQQWVTQVCRLLEQPTFAQAVARHGYNWVRREHRWSVTGRRLFEILASVCRGGPHPASGRTGETGFRSERPPARPEATDTDRVTACPCKSHLEPTSVTP